MKTPAFWYHGSKPPLYLRPLASLYAWGRAVHVAITRPTLSPVPTICVGNVTAGGNGKTPVVMALAHLLSDHSPIILSRGYGGTVDGPVQVQHNHTAYDVGDEAKLLSIQFPVMIGRQRLDGAQLIAAQNGKTIIMDDGLQNRHLRAHVNILVIDGTTGFGNGYLLPAGPLREPIQSALARTDIVMIIGDDRTGVTNTVPAHIPVFHARPIYETGSIDKAARYVAFAGIGRPEKFYTALRDLGLNITETHDFADHHAYTNEDIATLLNRAQTQGARLITTEKDIVKIAPDHARMIDVLPMRIAFDTPDALKDVMNTLLDRAAHAS